MARKASAASPVPQQDRDWMAEDDLRTLHRSDEIRRDSKRMSACRRIAKRQMSTNSRVLASKR